MRGDRDGHGGDTMGWKVTGEEADDGCVVVRTAESGGWGAGMGGFDVVTSSVAP